MKQDKDTARDLSETHISNMPDREFKAITLTGLEKRIEDFRDTETEELKIVRHKNAITEIQKR